MSITRDFQARVSPMTRDFRKWHSLWGESSFTFLFRLQPYCIIWHRNNFLIIDRQLESVNIFAQCKVAFFLFHMTSYRTKHDIVYIACDKQRCVFLIDSFKFEVPLYLRTYLILDSVPLQSIFTCVFLICSFNIDDLNDYVTDLLDLKCLPGVKALNWDLSVMFHFFHFLNKQLFIIILLNWS